MAPQSWDEQLHDRIVTQIRRLRTEQGLSAQALSDKTSAMGHTVSRSTIADLESGRRKYITAAELLLLASALNTAPVMLLFPGPYDNKNTIEVLPNVSEYQLSAVDWFCGEGTLQEHGFTGDVSEYQANTMTLYKARRLAEMRAQKIKVEADLRAAV